MTNAPASMSALYDSESAPVDISGGFSVGGNSGVPFEQEINVKQHGIRMSFRCFFIQDHS